MIRFFLLAFATFLLGACVTMPEAPTLALKSILYQGRFAISYEKQGEIAREQGGFEWKVQDTPQPIKAMQLNLLSPLGTTLAIIALDPGEHIEKQARFTSPTQTAYASDLDTLMQNLLGWRLPLTELTPWLSKTTPASPPDGWVISVLSRHNNGFPKVMTANNSTLKVNTRLVFEE